MACMIHESYTYMHQTTHFLQHCLEILFPPFCCHCHRDGELLCDSCFDQILFSTVQPQIILEKRYIDQVRVAAEFSYSIKSLIISLKYKKIKKVSVILGKMLYYCASFPEVHYVTAVPMHPWKYNQRGYNQAALIAQTFCKEAGLLYINCLEKNNYTQSQASVKDKVTRQKNSLDMYSLKHEYTQNNKIKNKSFLIIDDVLTTGNTLNECAKVLKQHGAKSVVGLVVAHKQS